MKKIFLIVMVSLVLITCGCEQNNKVNNKTSNKTNNNENISSDTVNRGLGPHQLNIEKIKDVEITNSLKLTDISFTVEENKSTFTAFLTNTSSTAITTSEIDVVIRSEQDMEITTLKLFVDGLSANETKKFDASINDKIERYKSFELKIIE